MAAVAWLLHYVIGLFIENTSIATAVEYTQPLLNITLSQWGQAVGHFRNLRPILMPDYDRSSDAHFCHSKHGHGYSTIITMPSPGQVAVISLDGLAAAQWPRARYAPEPLKHTGSLSNPRR